MSYSVPPLYVPKLNLNGGSGTTDFQHWGDPDANGLSSSIVIVFGDLNAVSGGLTALSASLLDVSSGTNGLAYVSSVLNHVSGDFYASGSAALPVISGALVMTAMAFFGTTDLVQLSAGLGGTTGSHPTGTFNDLRESFYAVVSGTNLSGTSGTFQQLTA